MNFKNFSVWRSNLGITLYVLPQALRKDALLFYNFCHGVDHLVDSTSLSNLEKATILSKLLHLLETKEAIPEYSPLLSQKCAEMMNKHHFEKRLLCELLHGMQMDLEYSRYETFEELKAYVWRVASTVGLMSAHLFGAHGKTVEAYAEALGIALQLTNILRDVQEDAQRGRIYLPLEELRRFSVSQEELLSGSLPPATTHLFRYQAERAFSYFAQAKTLWEKLPLSHQRKLRPARLMEAIYQGLLYKMEKDCFHIFEHRYALSFSEKAKLVFPALFF